MDSEILKATRLIKTNPAEATEIFTRVLEADNGAKTKAQVAGQSSSMEVASSGSTSGSGQQNSSKVTSNKEQAIMGLTKICELTQDAERLAELFRNNREFLVNLPKAKSSKLVQVMVDRFTKINNSRGVQIQVCLESIEWAKREKRAYLKQGLEKKLAGLYYEDRRYSKSLELVQSLLGELKKIDDKLELVQVHLLEAKIYLEVNNLPKAKAGLTNARTVANSIYTPPMLQGSLDLYSGIIHCEERDYNTAYSYFYEALEGLGLIYGKAGAKPKQKEKEGKEEERGGGQEEKMNMILYEEREQEEEQEIYQMQRAALMYMMLSKIMQLKPEQVSVQLGEGKTAGRFRGERRIEAMMEVAKAQQNRSLRQFEEVLNRYNSEFMETDNKLVKKHLGLLYDTLLGQNLQRVVEPFSRVEIQQVSQLVNLPVGLVENKLSQMILDNELQGILDHEYGCLVLFEREEKDELYEDSLGVVASMNKVIDSLFEKAKAL